MTISLDQIKALRDATGVSITACKKALVEAEGNHDKAIEFLRKRGEAKAQERADRVTGEGAIAYASGNGKLAIIALTCETDFVAISPEYIASAQEIADKVLAEGTAVDFSNFVTDLSTKMGEKVELREPVLLEGDVTGAYVHSNNKIGAAVLLTGGNEEVARDISMHITAADPKYLSPSEVSKEMLDKEFVIWNDELKNSNKPEQIWTKILDGKEKKFREENALLTQSFVKNPEMKIEEFVKSENAEIVKYVSVRI
jgi:elongation factor Ts